MSLFVGLLCTFWQPHPAFAEDDLQLITQDTNSDGVIDAARIYMEGCSGLGGGIGDNCGWSNFGYLDCPPGDTCDIPLSWIPQDYAGDVWVWMWCGDPWTYDCQILPQVPTVPPAKVESPSLGGRYAELSARWWQWLLSIPAAVNPNLDATGANCAVGQYDDVWFLAGAFGGQYTRQCTVPAGKPIFVPLVNTIVFKPLGSETLVDLRKQAAAFIDGIDVVECSLDGSDCFADRSAFRVRSPTFTVIAPPKGVIPPGQLKVPGNTDPIVSDGYWLLIQPPYAGAHTLKFKAANESGFSLEIEYDLTIE